MAKDAESVVDLKTLKGQTEPTFRVTAPEIENILYEPFPVLDHGFIRVVDYMGDDSSIVQAARISYGKGTKKVNEDRGLIRYLMRHRHTTPFEMCEIKLHVKLPLFVSREWLRHRTASINEYSGRYSILGKEFYIPQRNQLGKQSQTNRQGRGDLLNDEEANRVLEILKSDAHQVYEHYEEMLNADQEGNVLDANREGLTRELAWMNLTLNYYTEWYWKIDLHNLMHFLSLRADDHAQYEIRAYAYVILDILKRWVPLTYEAFMDYRFKSAYLSKAGLEVVKRMLKGQEVQAQDVGLSPREWRELMAQLEIEDGEKQQKKRA